MHDSTVALSIVYFSCNSVDHFMKSCSETSIDGGMIRKLSVINDKDLQKLHGILFDDMHQLRQHVSPAKSIDVAWFRTEQYLSF